MRAFSGMRSVLALLAVTTVAMAAPAEAKDAEKDVLAALETWKQAVLKKDRALFDKVYHPDLTYAHSTGVVENKAQAIEHIAGSPTPYIAVELNKTKVRMLGNNASVRGQLIFRQERPDKSINVLDLTYLTVWTKTKTGWQMIDRQTSRATPPTPPPGAAKAKAEAGTMPATQAAKH